MSSAADREGIAGAGGNAPRHPAPNVPEAPEFRLWFFGALLLTMVLGLWMWPRWMRGDVVQPLEFNHLIHAESGLECVDCHAGVLAAEGPGLPANWVCADCHEPGAPMTDSPIEALLLEYLEAGRPIEWQPLFRQPPHVYFPHRTHVSAGQIECSRCHGNIGELAQPPSSAPLKLTMQGCMDCHAENEVRNDCVDCHR